MNHQIGAPRGALGFAIAALTAALLSACGGGGGETTVAPTPAVDTAPTPAATPEALQPSATFAQQCAPANAEAPAARRVGSLTTEKRWIRSYFDEAYLWPEDVPAVNAAAAAYSSAATGADVGASLDAYFDALRSPVKTDSGKKRDQFSFMLSTAEWRQTSEAGVEAGYGVEWNLGSPTPPRRIRVAYVEPGGVAALAGLRRGDELVSVDGVPADVDDRVGIDKLNEALYPTASGIGHSFVVSRDGMMQTARTLRTAEAAKKPVLLRQVVTAADGAKVGHLVFNDHVLPAEAQLIEAVDHFKAQGIDDLVLDLRYNGGGYLFIASELSYMIAGPARTQGKVFERLSYNRKRSAEARDTPFYNASCIMNADWDCTDVKPLPTLNLNRVYVLTQRGTCSASEAIINGLRGVDVEVIQIGGQSCGKPYGFTAKDNCGYSYFPIEFVGVNAKGFGDYADGFAPGTGGGRKLPGCEVADDFGRALGDPAEGMLAAALNYRATGQCPPRVTAAKAPGAFDGLPMTLRRSPARENRFLLGARR